MNPNVWRTMGVFSYGEPQQFSELKKIPRELAYTLIGDVPESLEGVAYTDGTPSYVNDDEKMAFLGARDASLQSLKEAMALRMHSRDWIEGMLRKNIMLGRHLTSEVLELMLGMPLRFGTLSSMSEARLDLMRAYLPQRTRTAAVYFMENDKFYVAIDDIQDPTQNLLSITKTAERFRTEESGAGGKIVVGKDDHDVNATIERAREARRVVCLGKGVVTDRPLLWSEESFMRNRLIKSCFGDLAEPLWHYVNKQNHQSSVRHQFYVVKIPKLVIMARDYPDQALIASAILGMNGFDLTGSSAYSRQRGTTLVRGTKL